MSKILVTGGAGYIGSHVCVGLLNEGYDICIVDNLINSSDLSLEIIRDITGKDFEFYKTDILDKKVLENIFRNNSIDAVLHFAGLKSVEDSLNNPPLYYQNNVDGSKNLFDHMSKFNVKKIVFSSSAAVYGEKGTIPIKENYPLSPSNPYGKSKLMIEENLRKIFSNDPNRGISILRYFNVMGAHTSGNLGEFNLDKQTHLPSRILQVLKGKIDKLYIYGDDYKTEDGTCIRDYIHVMDLVNAHIKALEQMKTSNGLYTYNIGTGRGYSIKEIINEFRKVSGKNINTEIAGRREGDISISIADPALAEKELNWCATYDLTDMCKDQWKWFLNEIN